MDNHGEADNECHRENDEVISRTPANISNIIDQSVSVTVERLNYETNIEIKKERNNEFQLDENESFGDGEAQEDDSQRENHGRKHISTLTSRHYASHVRVFKGIACKICFLRPLLYPLHFKLIDYFKDMIRFPHSLTFHFVYNSWINKTIMA